LRIALVCDEYPPRQHGGIGTFVALYARGLHEEGHKVTVVQWGARDNEENRGGVRIVTLAKRTVPKLQWLLNRLRLRSWILNEAKQGQLDLVEVPDYLGYLPFSWGNTPVVVRLHLSLSAVMSSRGESAPPILRWCESHTLKCHPQWIGVSEFSMSLTRDEFRLSPILSHVIYYPLDLAIDGKNLLWTPPGRFICFCGRVSSRKGAVRLAKACVDILSSRKDAHLVFVGPIDEHDVGTGGQELLRLFEETDRSRVHILGMRDRQEALKIVEQAEIFVFPSKLETFGLVVAEAMWMGVPVITSNLPPFTEFVSDGETGFLIDLDDRL